MSTTQRIAKNTIALYIAQIVIALQGIALSIVIARQLGDVVLGQYSFAVALSTIFGVFYTLGYPVLIAREVARAKSLASKYLGNIIIVQAFLSVVVFGLLAIVVKLMAYPGDTVIVLLIFGLYQIFFSFSSIFQATFVAFERMEYVAIGQITSAVVTLALAVTATFLGYGLIVIASAFLVGGVFQLVLNIIVCVKKFARPRLALDLDFSKTAFKVALPLTVMQIASIIYIRISTVMLSVMKGDEAVGWLTAAFNIVFMLTPIPVLFMQAIFPKMSVDALSSIESLKRSTDRTMRLMIAFGLPLAAGTTLVANRVIPVFFGQEFDNSIITLQIMAWYIFFAFLYIPFSNILVAMNRQNSWLVLACGGANLQVILSLVLIPYFSYKGAAIVFVITGFGLFAGSYYMISKYLCRLNLLRMIGSSLIPCAAMVLFTYFCSGLNLALLIACSIFIYFAALFLVSRVKVQVVYEETIRVLRRLVKGGQDP
jgi:O-antigen/teichoic acid export membrane protein